MLRVAVCEDDASLRSALRRSLVASGADDYLTKPFDLAELLVRIAALARRATAPPGSGRRTLQLDAATHALRYGERNVSLTPTEFRLLAKLVGEQGRIVRRAALAAARWPIGATVSDNTLDSYIRRIRRKLASLERTDRSIETVRGVGYSWR